MGRTKPCTNDKIEPLSRDPLSRLDCNSRLDSCDPALLIRPIPGGGMLLRWKEGACATEKESFLICLFVCLAAQQCGLHHDLLAVWGTDDPSARESERAPFMAQRGKIPNGEPILGMRGKEPAITQEWAGRSQVSDLLWSSHYWTKVLF